MSVKPARRRDRASPITRLAGVATQFRRVDDGYIYRRDGAGPPIAVTAEERDGFVRASLWMLAVHAGLFAVFLAALAVLAPHVFQRFGEVGGAAVLAALGCAAAGLLFASFRWTTQAPARALAGRPVSTTAPPVDPAAPPGYGTILGGAAVALIWSAVRMTDTPRFAMIIAISTLLVAPAMAVLTWRADRRLTPEQRRRAATARAAARAEARRKVDVKGALLILVFLVVELGVMAAALVLGIQGMLAAFGSPADAPDGVAFFLGVGLGLLAGYCLVRPIDALGERLTGCSILEALRDLPSL